MTDRLRIAVFTAGEITAIDRMFYESLAADPSFELVGIVVDGWRPHPKPVLRRIVRQIREDGGGWIAWKIESKIRSIGQRVVARFLDRVHGLAVETSSALPIRRVDDIRSEQAAEIIRSLRADIGVIVGGRILPSSITGVPRYGSLNIHKLKLPQYRGGGPVGYWEIVNGETSIGVSIHYATADVDAGPIVARIEIPIEECDTLESLRIKADLAGVDLYLDALHRIARGDREAAAQDLSRGKTYRAPSEYKVARLQQRLEREARRKRGLRQGFIATLARLRVAIESLAVLPKLQRMRRGFTADRRAPISIFFYHLVAERALNHMCLSLPAFVRQMEFLRRHYALLPLDTATARLSSRTNDQIAAAITFDDGYRDNEWAIRYLRHMRIPATFFVSIGHVLDGQPFEHDVRRGYTRALPMTAAGVRELAANGFTIGSHAIHHEDFGALTPAEADRILRESRNQIAATCGGAAPHYFAFPKGKRGTNITPPALELALQHYGAVFSAYGGYAFPESGRRHFVRMSNANDLFELHLAMSGYTGFRASLAGNGWGIETSRLDPAKRELNIALIAASPRIVGGHSIQAAALSEDLRASGHNVEWIEIDPLFPPGLRWLRRVPVARTLLNQLLYIPSLLRVRSADIVHIFAASYWSFILGPAPAMLMARLFNRRVVLHYHSGEAGDHLTRWRRALRVLLRLAHEIVVPSAWLQGIFAAHGYAARVIQNVVDIDRFRYRERVTPRPHLLSVRNLERGYEVENTVAAFAEVKRRYPEATLTIAGHGSRERSVRSLAATLGLSDVRFVGRVEPSALPSVYDEADIFLNSSIVDNQPVSILEAFAAGLPVVSTPPGDIPSMLCGGEAGLLVAPNAPAEMAQAVASLIDNPAASLRISRRALAEAEMHVAGRVRKQWTSLYSELLHA